MKYIRWLLLGLLVVGLLATRPGVSRASAKGIPADDLATAVAQAAPGATILVDGGVYHGAAMAVRSATERAWVSRSRGTIS